MHPPVRKWPSDVLCVTPSPPPTPDTDQQLPQSGHWQVVTTAEAYTDQFPAALSLVNGGPRRLVIGCRLLS